MLFSNILNLLKTKTDGKTIYFKNGYLYKIKPSDANSYYDAKYLVSDGSLYNLENIDDLKKIPVPNFIPHNNFMNGYGVTGNLDYVLRMKAGSFFNRNEKELCSACLWKSTELMLHSNIQWRKKDYDRLIKWHLQLDMPEQATKAINYLEQQGFIYTDIEKSLTNIPSKKTRSTKTALTKEKSSCLNKLSTIEKEQIIVNRVTINDMKELNGIPFVWNTTIKKHNRKGSHPFAYMDIINENVQITKLEIEKINKLISYDLEKYPNIKRGLYIDFNKLVFHSKNYGYTRLLCSPKTYTGKISKYPLTLFFATDFSVLQNSVHGEIVYGKNGIVAKANICFWQNGKSVFLCYKLINNVLTLTSIE